MLRNLEGRAKDAFIDFLHYFQLFLKLFTIVLIFEDNCFQNIKNTYLAILVEIHPLRGLFALFYLRPLGHKINV